MNVMRKILLLLMLAPWAVRADEYVGLSHATLSLAGQMDVYTALTSQGYQEVTNELFEGKILWRPAEGTLATVVDQNVVSLGATTSMVVKVTDAVSAQWLYFDGTSATSSPPQPFEPILSRLRPRLTNAPAGKIVCAMGNYTHLTPEVRKLALSFLIQAQNDQDLVCTDSTRLIDEIQLQGEISRQNKSQAARVVGHILAHDLVIILGDARAHEMNVSAVHAVDGKKLFSMQVSDESQFPGVFDAIKNSLKPAP